MSATEAGIPCLYVYNRGIGNNILIRTNGQKDLSVQSAHGWRRDEVRKGGF
jgi:hypothetical protein